MVDKMSSKNYDLRDVVIAFSSLLRIKTNSNGKSITVYELANDEIRDQFLILLVNNVIAKLKEGERLNLSYNNENIDNPIVSQQLKEILSSLPKLPNNKEYGFLKQTYIQTDILTVENGMFKGAHIVFSKNIENSIK